MLVYVCVLFLGLFVMTVHADWQATDLTQITGAPSVAWGLSIAMAFDPVWNGMRTHYLDFNSGHVHELYLLNGTWQDADLTQITGGPNGGAIDTAFDPVWNGIRTNYIAADRHVHELYLLNGTWQDADLTQITGGPNANGFAIATAFDPVWNGMRTNYVAEDRHVHELYLLNGTWQDADLTQITGGPDASPDSIATAFDPVWNGIRIHYIASNTHVHELFLFNGTWQDADFTLIAGAPTACFILTCPKPGIAMAFDPVWNGMRTHYLDSSSHVHELFLFNGIWQNADLTQRTGGPNGADAIAMAFDPVWNGMRTHYVAYSSYHVIELFLAP
jgi:hypothetical protein